MVCLAFVRVDDVIFAFEALRKEDPSEEFQSLSDYFDDNYIGACRGNRRLKPKFDIADWNVFNRVLSGEPRTNNALEAWNSCFNKLVSTKHPALPKLITRFKDVQKKDEQKRDKFTRKNNTSFTLFQILNKNLNFFSKLYPIYNQERKQLKPLSGYVYNFSVSQVQQYKIDQIKQ